MICPVLVQDIIYGEHQDNLLFNMHFSNIQEVKNLYNKQDMYNYNDLNFSVKDCMTTKIVIQDTHTKNAGQNTLLPFSLVISFCPLTFPFPVDSLFCPLTYPFPVDNLFCSLYFFFV